MSLHDDHRALVSVAALGFLFLSLMIAVLPAYEAQKTILPPPPVSAEITRGREIYLKEGCAVCHTQFVRDLAVDAPYGRGSVASDYAAEDPPLLGTQRTGPDLANAGARQPNDVWHLIHLYDPRAVVPTSVMPAYPWYFESKPVSEAGDLVVPVPERYRRGAGVVVANADAVALVRYLQSLKQTPVQP